MNPALISRLAKERFLLKMSEDDFRDRVVRPILFLRGFKDGRDLCGPTEQGKDALFYDYDKLGSFELTVIQTKKGSANLAAKAHSNIVDLVAQLRTAAGTSYAVLRPIRANKKPLKVILAVSGKINDAARKHLVAEVNETKLGFLDVDELIPWIDELLPQLWLDMDANVSIYFAALEKQLIGGDGPFARQFLPTDSVVAKSCFDDTAVSVYVRHNQALNSTKPNRNSKKEDLIFPLHGLPSKPYKRILLLGEGGGGKTVGLLQIVYKSAKLGLESGKTELIPVLVKASDIAGSRPINLVGYLEENSRALSAQKKPVFGLSDLDAGRVCVFVDGLDEVGAQTDRTFVSKLTLEFSVNYPKCSVTIATRPYEYLADISELATFERFSIVPITWKDAEKIFELVKTKKNITSEKSRETLAHLSQIQGFDLNPLMVSVYAATSNFDLQDVPPNITELFKRFTEQMLGRWDEQRGLQNLHRPVLKDFALCCLAFEMHAKRITKILRSDAAIVIKDRLSKTGHLADVEGLLSEILDRSGLFRDFGTEIGFRHHLFQEFFAGRGIESRETVGSLLKDSWWRRAIVFYFGEHPKDASDFEKHLKDAEALEPSEKFGVACTAGLALQACYLSPVVTKLDTWKRLVEVFVNLRVSYLSENSMSAQLPILTKVSYLLQLRDALALSNIVEANEQLRTWVNNKTIDDVEVFFAMYAIALMRVGRFDLLSAIDIEKIASDDSNLLMVFLELTEGESIRPISSSQKTCAGQLIKPISKKLQNVGERLLVELELQLEIHKVVQAKISERTQSDLPTKGLLESD